MSEKVHPGSGCSSDNSGEQQSSPRKRPHPPPPSSGFVIQVPKDQIFRVPPPENAHRYKLYTRKAKNAQRHRRCCFCLSCRCLTFVLASLLVLVLLAAISAGALYLVYQPRFPSFAVESLSFRGRNLTEPSLVVLARNPNTKIGIFYERGGTVRALHYGAVVGTGSWPVFRLAPGDGRGVRAALAGGRIGEAQRMETDGRRGTVPVTVEIRVPAKLKVGATTGRVTVKGVCQVILDKVGPNGKATQNTCNVKLELQ